MLPDGLRERGLGRSTSSTPTARCRPRRHRRAARRGRRRPTSSRSPRRPPSSASSTPSAPDAVPAGGRLHRPGHRRHRTRARPHRRRRGRRPHHRRPRRRPGRLGRCAPGADDARGGRLRLRRPDHRQRVGDLRDGGWPPSRRTATSCRWRRGRRSSAPTSDDDELEWATLCARHGHRRLRAGRLRRRLRGPGPFEPRRAAAAARRASSCVDSLTRPAVPDRRSRRRRAATGSSATSAGSGSTSHFGALVGADLVGGVGKPAPDVYLRACADLGADPRAQRRPRGLRPRRHAPPRPPAWPPSRCPSRITRVQRLRPRRPRRGVARRTLTVADLAALVDGSPR